MRWQYFVVEVYCHDASCKRPLADHLGYRQGGWAMAHLGRFLAVLGPTRILKALCGIWWFDLRDFLRWHLWEKWFWDEEKELQEFWRWATNAGVLPQVKTWLYDYQVESRSRCSFPESSRSSEPD